MDDFDGGGGGFRSPLLMMMGAAVPVMIFFLFMTLVVPMVLYLVARSRQNREGPPDPQLGIVPDVPLAYWGWGAIPDQYGRRWDGDDGEARLPRDLRGTDLPPLRPGWGPARRT